VIAFNGKTHLIFGLAVALVISNIHYFTPLDVFILIMLGSILPDIDHPKSLAGRFFFFVPWFCSHRGHMHTIGGCALLALPCLVLGFADYSLLLIGGLTHLASDFISGLRPGHMPLRLRWW